MPVSNGTSYDFRKLVGTAGITIATSSTSTTISTAGFDNTANINFTGNNTHAGTETFNATATFSGVTSAPYLAPVGAIEMYASSTAPNGWLLANGVGYATSSYPSLFSLIGYQYGGSAGTFNVPNLQGRTVFGATSTAPFSSTVGSTGGVATTTVSVNFYTTSPTFSGGGGSGYYGFTQNNTTPITSSSSDVSTLSPYMILNYIIKY